MRSNKVFSTLKRVHNRKIYMEKERGLEKCKEGNSRV